MMVEECLTWYELSLGFVLEEITMERHKERWFPVLLRQDKELKLHFAVMS